MKRQQGTLKQQQGRTRMHSELLVEQQMLQLLACWGLGVVGVGSEPSQDWVLLLPDTMHPQLSAVNKLLDPLLSGLLQWI